MSRTWILALAGSALVVLAVFFFRDGKRKAPPEPVSTPAASAAEPPPPQAIAVPAPSVRTKGSDCVPLPDGGLSCGVCRDNSDCADGATCVLNRLSGRSECQQRSCQKNEDCAQGLLCRIVGRTPSNAPLRACVPPGDRSSGSACDPNQGGDPGVSCGPQLVCVDGGCAPACERREVDEDSTCPGSHECVETEGGWGCIPTCKYGATCGAGKTCTFLSVENPISLCTHVDGPNCLGSKGGCPANTDCVVETNARAERTTFRCYPRCGEEQSCPDGSVCVAGKKTAHCRRSCTPDAASQCGANERCVKAGVANRDWFCSAT